MSITTGTRVTIPETAIPPDWARTGQVTEITDHPGTGITTAVVELDDGHRQELPADELTADPAPRLTAPATGSRCLAATSPRSSGPDNADDPGRASPLKPGAVQLHLPAASLPAQQGHPFR